MMHCYLRSSVQSKRYFGKLTGRKVFGDESIFDQAVNDKKTHLKKWFLAATNYITNSLFQSL